MKDTPPLIVFTLVGLCAAAGSGYLYWRDASRDAKLLSAQGEVVSTTSFYHNGERRYQANIEWTDSKRMTHQYVVLAQSAGTHIQGQKIDLRYDQSMPEEAHEPGRIGIASGMFGVLSAVILFICAQLWWRMMKRS